MSHVARSTFVPWHDRACSVRQHCTGDSVVMETCSVVASARDLLGRTQVAERFRRLNQDGIDRSIMNGQLGAHHKQIPPKFLDNGNRTFLADKIRYMLKSPRTAYPISKREQVTSDGEILGCFRQKKSDSRKGDRITCSTSRKICISISPRSAVETIPACSVESRRQPAGRVGPSGF
jgi:hypothetical protein